MENNTIETWYTMPGPYDDVVISTRVRLARNLADFPFIAKMSDDDKFRVNSLVYDAVADNPDVEVLDYKTFTQAARNILVEKNVLTDRDCTSVILDRNNSSSILVNETDHVKIAHFVPGLDCEKAMEVAYKMDEELQKKLQFAASYEFGYLTSHIKDCGTGMKISFRCFIPSIILEGRMAEIVDYIREKKFTLHSPYTNTECTGDFGNCIFDVITSSAAGGTELDQMAAIQSIGVFILQTERKIRQEFADNNPTIVLNFVKQAYAKLNYSLLLSYEEGVNIISAIKWGLLTGVVYGIEQNEVNALFLRTKDGHIKYLCDNYAFSFEEDVKKEEYLQIQRLRTIVIQQALEKLNFKD